VEPEDDAVGMSRPDSFDNVNSIEETLAILSDPLAMEQIRESEGAGAAGELGVSLADVGAGLDRRRRDAEA
jgi:hypothetical protein